MGRGQSRLEWINKAKITKNDTQTFQNYENALLVTFALLTDQGLIINIVFKDMVFNIILNVAKRSFVILKL